VILLDTNVVSELMRPQPNRAVLDWINRCPPDDVWVTVVAQAEILAGIERLPAGQRRDALVTEAKAVFEEDFRGRILAFQSHAAIACARILADRHREGRAAEILDTILVAIASVEDAAIATRNIKDFMGSGVELIDPWQVGEGP
jgi:toxin FitB